MADNASSSEIFMIILQLANEINMKEILEGNK